MTIYAYARVSTDTQDLDSQRHGIIEYAKNQGWFDRNAGGSGGGQGIVFFDDKASGTKDWQEREIGRLLCEVAKQGDEILTAEFSRLGRSALQVMLVLEEAAKRGVTIHIVKNGLVMDGSLNARMMALAFSMAAEIEREFISKRTSEALASRKAKGLPIGRQKGSKNKNRKLDGKRDEILKMLNLGVPKMKVAGYFDCDIDTLYKWLNHNGLGSYINGRSEKEEKPQEEPSKAKSVKAKKRTGKT